MPTGNPRSPSRSVMPALVVPTAHAATNIATPRCTPRSVASANTPTKMAIAPAGANEAGISLEAGGWTRGTARAGRVGASPGHHSRERSQATGPFRGLAALPAGSDSALDRQPST